MPSETEDEPVAPLVDRLRAASRGYDEWRVQHPVEKSYCISFSRKDCAFPEHEAAEWLKDFQKKFPDHRHAKFVVAKVRVLNNADRLMIEAADEIERLNGEPLGVSPRCL